MTANEKRLQRFVPVSEHNSALQEIYSEEKTIC